MDSGQPGMWSLQWQFQCLRCGYAGWHSRLFLPESLALDQSQYGSVCSVTGHWEEWSLRSGSEIVNGWIIMWFKSNYKALITDPAIESDCLQKIEQTLVLFRHLNTEPYIFTLQALERRAVPDHKSLLNATFKYIERGNPVFQNLYQQEVWLNNETLWYTCSCEWWALW